MPLITDEANAAHDHIFAEQDIIEPLRSVRDERYKLVFHLQDGKNQLYDTIADPGEKKDIVEQNPEILRTLSVHLADYIRKNEPPEKEKLHRWEQVRPFKYIVDEVTTSARLQFFGMSYDDIVNWVEMSDGGENYNNACYWIKPGDGSKGVLWRSENPLLGTYNIYIWYGKLFQKPSATNAHFVVITRQGSQEFVIDQNKNIGKWNLLGKFKDPLCVKVTNQADGPVVVDTVKFEDVVRFYAKN